MLKEIWKESVRWNKIAGCQGQVIDLIGEDKGLEALELSIESKR